MSGDASGARTIVSGRPDCSPAGCNQVCDSALPLHHQERPPPANRAQGLALGHLSTTNEEGGNRAGAGKYLGDVEEKCRLVAPLSARGEHEVRVIRLEGSAPVIGVRSRERDECGRRDPEQERSFDRQLGHGLAENRHHPGCGAAVDDGRTRDTRRLHHAGADDTDRPPIPLTMQCVGPAKDDDDGAEPVGIEPELGHEAPRIGVDPGVHEGRLVSIPERGVGHRHGRHSPCVPRTRDRKRPEASRRDEKPPRGHSAGKRV
jgi:hypothetical protein